MVIAIPFLNLFDATADPRLGPKSSHRTDVDGATNESSYIYCGTCSEVVTTTADRIERDPQHRHCFRNAEGIVFEIGCFRTAMGCSTVGVPTMQWTWFPEYSWVIAVCANCNQHLGWYYRGGGGDNFFGLILNALRSQ